MIRAVDGRDAALYRVRQGLIPGFVLAVPTPEDTWQFGLNSWTNIEPHFPFPVRLRYSLFSILVRVVASAYLAWIVYRSLTLA